MMDWDVNAARARWVNLLVPGGGMILLGAIGLGVLSGLLFGALACGVIAGSLLIPDDVPRWLLAALLAATAAVYLGTQISVHRMIRRHALRTAEHQRRVALQAARELLRNGQGEDALAALAPLAAEAEDNLLIAVRFAQALTHVGNVAAATAAWQRVRRLDRHQLYRDEWLAAAQRFARLNDADPSRTSFRSEDA